jgi:hypothetical protein
MPEPITHEVISKVTQGRVDQKALANWTDRELWVSELAPVERGKPRHYSRVNVIEAAIADRLCNRLGLRRPLATGIIKSRAHAVAVPTFGMSYWAGDLRKAFNEAPEFNASACRFWWWIIVVNTDGDDKNSMGWTIAAEERDLPSRIADLQKDDAGLELVLLPVGRIVNAVDMAIEDDGIEGEIVAE